MAATMIPPRWAVTPWNSKADLQLTAAAPIAAGEVIVSERPLVSIPEGHYQLGTFTWDLVERLLTDPEKLDEYFSWRLKASEFYVAPDDAANERVLAKRYTRPRELVRRLYCSVSTNNIGYFDGARVVEGHGLYRTLSRANHSCCPSARMESINIDKQEIGLVADRDLAVGEAITWNYFSEAFLAANFETRNANLVNSFLFVCSCERCAAEIPPHLAAEPNLRKYFERRIVSEIVARGEI